MKGELSVEFDDEAPAAGSPSQATLALSDLGETLGFLLSLAQQYTFREFAVAFGDSEVTPRLYSILALIAANPGCRQVDIGDTLGVLQTNLVKRIDALVELGLVERRPDERDRRAKVLGLTGKGVAEVSRMRAIHDAMTRDLKDRMGRTEYDQLIEMLRRFVRREEGIVAKKEGA